MEPTKVCSACLIEKALSDYYKAGKYHQKRCKPCHNKCKKHTKKPTGFLKLPKITRDAVLSDMADNLNMSKISKRHGINYNTLRLWKSKNMLVPIVE
jgi:hypothetical protein